MEPSKESMIGNALEGLKTHHGYKVLIDEVIFPMYRDALLELEAVESLEARATIRALKNIIEKIDDSINLGRMASEEYKQKFIQHRGTGE